MAFPKNLLYMNGNPTGITRRAYVLMDDLTNKAGCFGLKCTLTPDEERALDILMDIFIHWSPGDGDDYR